MQASPSPAPVQCSTPSRPLRVVFLTPSLHMGGAERWILSLAGNFQDGCEAAGVVLCTPHFQRAIVRQAARLMPVYAARRWGDPYETRRLLRWAGAAADVLVSWGVPRLEVVTGDLPIPVVDVSHSDGAWRQQTKMVRRAARGADFHVAVSRSALAAFPESIRPRAKVIYNGVEVDRVAPRRSTDTQQRATWNIGPRDRVALFLGRFDAVKGPLRLLDAIDHLPRHWTAVFHGHGPLERELRTQAAPRGERCRILPPEAHVGDALAAADVLVMPSDFEGMPLALVEAWLAGTPAVSTPIGFVREAERMHGPLCEIVPPRPTGQQLADGILRAVRRIYVEPARRIAWQHYTAAAMVQRWEEYLREVVRVWASQARSVSEGREHPLAHAAGFDHCEPPRNDQ